MIQPVTFAMMLAHFTLKLLLIALPLKAAYSLLVLAPLRPHVLLLHQLIALMQITVFILLPYAVLIQMLILFVVMKVHVLILFQFIALKQILQDVPSIQLLLAHALKVLLPKVVVPLPALLLQLFKFALVFALV